MYVSTIILLLTLVTDTASTQNTDPTQEISDQPVAENDLFDKYQFVDVIADKRRGMEVLVNELEERARKLQAGQDGDSALMDTVYEVTEEANSVFEDAFLYLERAFVQLWKSHQPGPEPPFCGAMVEYVLSWKQGNGAIDNNLASTFLTNDLQCFASKVKDVFREFEDHSEEDDLPTPRLLKDIKDVLSKLIDLGDFRRGLQTSLTIMKQESETIQELGQGSVALTEGQGQDTMQAATEQGPDEEGPLQGDEIDDSGNEEEEEEEEAEEEEDGRLAKEVTRLLRRYILERDSQVGDVGSQGYSRRKRSVHRSARLARYVLYTV